MDIFKRKLDSFLQGAPDQSGCGGPAGRSKQQPVGSSSHKSSLVSGRAWGVEEPPEPHPGTTPLTQGATPLTQGATPLTQGATPLTQGATPLTQGATPLTQGATPLTQGATPLTQGATPLTQDKNTSHSFVSSFAGDAQIGMKISSVEDTEKLQADINTVFDWATENNMMFNGDKFQEWWKRGT
ncbi:merozoite surface protein CMZ-8-like [Procambarus clarkii]|uniref:merozoite surface protein CMZ-8-like n=1 Tax=Procambarus clarkii TaxID=6728 RepID=UPI0037427981